MLDYIALSSFFENERYEKLYLNNDKFKKTISLVPLLYICHAVLSTCLYLKCYLREHVKHLSCGFVNFCHMGTTSIIIDRKKELKTLSGENEIKLRGI